MRYNLYIPVHISGREKGGKDVRESTVSVNVGSDGLFALTSYEWSVNETVILSIPVGEQPCRNGGGALLSCGATIVSFVPKSSDGWNGIGMRFDGGFRLAVGAWGPESSRSEARAVTERV